MYDASHSAKSISDSDDSSGVVNVPCNGDWVIVIVDDSSRTQSSNAS